MVTDLQMPVMNGLELTRRLCHEFPQIPVIVTTGVGNEEVAAEALRLGAASYVPKRRLESMFVPTIRRMMRRVYPSGSIRQFEPFATNAELHMEVGNDDAQLPHLVASLVEHIRFYGFCSERELIRIGTALEECLLNAMIHGNLEIESELRELERGRKYRQLIQERRQQNPYAERKVHIRVRVTQEQIKFVVADEGRGFDPTLVPDPTDPLNIGRVNGRGLLLITTFMDQVKHNPAGNEITMVKLRQVPTDAVSSVG